MARNICNVCECVRARVVTWTRMFAHIAKRHLMTAKLPNQRKIAPHSHSYQLLHWKKKTPWAENTSVSWQLLHATDWFACFSLIFLFGFVCAVLFSSAACQPGIRIAYCYILSTKVSAWLSRDTSFFFARLCFSPPKKLIVTIDFHVTFYVISYHSFNFFIFSNLTHLPPHQLFSVQKSFMEDFRWRIQFFTNALLTWIFHRGSS